MKICVQYHQLVEGILLVQLFKESLQYPLGYSLTTVYLQVQFVEDKVTEVTQPKLWVFRDGLHS